MRKRARTAVIIGAGPAGLTAAYELLTRSDIRPIVIEMSDQVGGISRTVNYRGNRIDLGGHRFFSKSDRVMNWWLQHLSLQESDAAAKSGAPLRVSYQGKSREVEAARSADPDRQERVMLVRNRKSRIYFLRKFFDYPISLSADTIRKLGLARTGAIGVSYMRRVLFPLKEQKNLEQFFINRFGDKLYRTFFKSYTEKVWGVPCTEIDAEWGAQRIKELSIWKSVKHFVKKSVEPQARRDCAARDGDVADRTLPLSQVWPRADVGRGRAQGAGDGRLDRHGTVGPADRSARKSRHRGCRRRRSGPSIPLRRGFRFLYHAYTAPGALFADGRARQRARSQRRA